MQRNIKCFDFCTLVIADVLYRNFPIAIDLEPNNILTPEDKQYIQNCKGVIQADIENSYETEIEIIFSQVIMWLHENEFLIYNAEHHDRNCNAISLFRSVRLTAKGLLILKQTPKSLKKGQLGELITNGLKNGLKQAVQSEASKGFSSVPELSQSLLQGIIQFIK